VKDILMENRLCPTWIVSLNNEPPYNSSSIEVIDKLNLEFYNAAKVLDTGL
jgi:hypothetical protein